jgi:plastocyanin
MKSWSRTVACCTILLAAACGGGYSTDPYSPGTTTGNPTGQTGTPVQTSQIGVSDDMFSPADVEVTKGTTVTWTWNTGTTHNVTFGDGSSGDKGGTGVTYQKTFNTAGTYSYTCTLHYGMKGSVVVK